jgi:hypothetical protein
MPKRRARKDTTETFRPSPLDGPPDLGNGAERFDDEGLGLGRDDGPESQGRRSGQGFGLGDQGDYGDENYDPADQRGLTAPDDLGSDATAAADAAGMQVEHVGPGRGSGGGSTVVEPVVRTGRGEEPTRADAGIREDIVDLIGDAELADPDDLAIDVRDGVVTLEGVVDDQETRDELEAAVTDVAGVRGIENLLQLRDAEA